MNSPDFRRSNGRIPACEPCKKRKVACDHLRPICTRCITRGHDDACIYLDHESPRPTRTRRPRRPPPADAVVSPALSATVFRASTGSSQATSPDPTAPVSAGYLGFTSFSAVFQEAGISTGNVSSALPPADADSPGPYLNPGHPISTRIRETCLTLLQRVPERARAIHLFRKRAGPLEGWIRFVAERLLESLFETFGHYLGRTRKPSHLETLARQLCANTIAPFSDDEPDPGRWMAQFSGHKMRWESIGILLCFWDEDSPASKADVDGWVSVDRESLDLCVELCKRLSRGNSLMLYLTYRLMVAESLFSGDASLATWRLHGEVVSLLTFLGFHAEENNSGSEYQPNFSSEIKRKLCAIVYIFDIVYVSFTGRPPLLNNNYLITPLPLDLQDEDLALDQVSLRAKADRLDARGWNKEDGVYCTTVIRAWGMLASIREEVFHIALGKGKSAGSVTIQTFAQLKKRELDTVSHFPTSLQHSLDDLVNSRLDIIVLYSRLVLHLEHLQNLFFIERLLLRHGQTDDGDLLAVSFEMVTYTLYFWTHLDRLLAVRRDCEWLVMSYAAPAAGILCMELLKPRPDIAEKKKKKNATSRSKIVQKLSLLVGYLDWVGPSGPNGELCQTCKVTIEHVLDQAININDAPSTNDKSAPFSALNSPFEVPAELSFNFDLLDTFEWLRSEPS
ncbi:hypothetical protein F5Y06DRAFT_142892 [Hypoxylon sp. FL0890]|nr:hypothetical protein F5Y06DRAFT_142892 [Hypoxylon sp. FL0890]